MRKEPGGVLEVIRKRPPLYLGSPSRSALWNFIQGYNLALRDHNLEKRSTMYCHDNFTTKSHTVYGARQFRLSQGPWSSQAPTSMKLLHLTGSLSFMMSSEAAIVRNLNTTTFEIRRFHSRPSLRRRVGLSRFLRSLPSAESWSGCQASGDGWRN